MIKIYLGLVGVSTNTNARQHFFLTLPEISYIAGEFEMQIVLRDNTPEGHHALQPNQEHEAIDKIKAAILNHGNSFAVEGDQLFNFIPNACVPKSMLHKS